MGRNKGKKRKKKRPAQVGEERNTKAKDEQRVNYWSTFLRWLLGRPFLFSRLDFLLAVSRLFRDEKKETMTERKTDKEQVVRQMLDE